MKYFFQINIVCNIQEVLDTIIAAFPLIDDPRVIPDDYRPATQRENEVDGSIHLYGMVMFHLKSDRDDVAAIIQDITGVLTDCEVGTILQNVDTTHRKEGAHIVADGPCEPTLIIEVVL